MSALCLALCEEKEERNFTFSKIDKHLHKEKQQGSCPILVVLVAPLRIK